MYNNIPRPHISKTLILFFILFTIIIMVGNYLYIISMKNENILHLHEQLSAISKLKVDQIKRWRNERLDEAKYIYNNNDFKLMVNSYYKNKVSKNLQITVKWLKTIKENREYSNIFLTDNRMKLIPLFGGNNSELLIKDKDIIERATLLKEIVLSDFHKDPDSDNIYLGIAVPLILAENGIDKTIGILLLRIDPSKILFPLIQSWPTPSKTAETLLIRRDGDEIVFLNELRHKKNTALEFHLPLNNDKLPAAMAVRGKTGIFEGIDYRGIEVVSDLNKIPGSDWFIVAKIDSSEINTDINEKALWILLFSCTLIVMIALSIYLISKQQQIQHIKKLLKLEQEKQALKIHFEYLVKYANDVIILFDEEFKIIEGNERAIKTYGYTKDEFIKLKAENLRAPKALENLQFDLKQIDSSTGYVFETLHITKDGKIFPVEVSSRLINIDSKKFYQSIIRDITERKNFENRIIKINRIYSVLSNINQSIVRIDNKQQLFDEVCKIAVNYGLLRMAWIGIIDKERKLVNPVSDFGHVEGYLNNIKITIDDQVAGINQVGSALNDGRHFLCNDIENNSYNIPWLNEAIKRGYKSLIILPLFLNKVLIGTFNLYADEKNFFDEEEIKLLEELAMDISYAIENFNKEEKRKEIEEALKESEEKYRHLFELESDALFLIDNETGNILEVNTSACNLYGYTREELLKMKNVDVSAQPDETRNSTISTLTKIPIRFHRKKDGTVFPVEINASRLTWQGRQVHMPAIRDITERLKAEIALKESQQMLRIILDTIPVRVFWKDLNLNYIGCNLSFAVDAGLKSTNEIIGKNDFELRWSDDAEKYRMDDFDVIKSGIPRYNYEEMQTTPDGNIMWLLTSKVPLHDTEGKIRGILGTYEEITKRKLAEQEIKKLNIELEKRVEVRTEQLQTVNKDLEAFSYSVSHDLRTPLRAIDGFTRILADEYINKLDGDGKDLLNNVIRNTVKMSQLIDDLLNFSRLGQKVLNNTEILMEELFNEVFNDIKDKDRKIEFKLAQLPCVYADRNLLKQVVINLLSNAIKFTRKKELSLIEVGGKIKSNENIFWVKDNGVGFDMKFSDKLFNVFQRLHSEAEFEGTGVGLAIVQRIINKHSGHIWAEGEPGIGATFYFSLPKENNLI